MPLSCMTGHTASFDLNTGQSSYEASYLSEMVEKDQDI